MMFKILILFLMSFQCFSYVVFANKKSLKSNIPVRVIVTGEPEKLGELLSQASYSMFEQFEQSTEDQLIIVGRNADKDYLSHKKDLFFLAADEEDLSESSVSDVISQFQKLNSLDIYSHANVLNGAILSKGNWLAALDGELVDILKERLAKDGYVNFHGCNTGFILAPFYAKRINKIAIGNLTSTDFQFIFENNLWGFDYTFPIGTKKSALNSLNLLGANNNKCYDGLCVRMKTDNHPYDGYWGNWKEAGGFPIPKIFCGTDLGNCKKGALNAYLHMPSILPVVKINSIKDFKLNLRDLFCPFSGNTEKQSKCFLELEKGEMATSTYSPFNGKTLNCSLKNCEIKVECNNSTDCKVVDLSSNKNSTSFIDEYRFLLEAYKN